MLGRKIAFVLVIHRSRTHAEAVSLVISASIRTPYLCFSMHARPLTCRETTYFETFSSEFQALGHRKKNDLIPADIFSGGIAVRVPRGTSRANERDFVCDNSPKSISERTRTKENDCAANTSAMAVLMNRPRLCPTITYSSKRPRANMDTQTHGEREMRIR